jgi:uncharacterized protein (TIGR00661 family)
MARCLFIVQGEGKGHMSQALAMKEFLEDAGHTVESVLLGTRDDGEVPDYFHAGFSGKLQTFRSPWFLRTPNKKGIYVGRTLLVNLLYSFDYLKTVSRIRREIAACQPDVVFNFYELLGALAMRRSATGIKKIGVGHHFYLYLNQSVCKVRPVWHRWLLRLHTRMIIQSCDTVLALSFRKDQGSGIIQVVPPLVRREFREMDYIPGESYLGYMLHEGFIYDILMLAKELPDFRADLFTSLEPAFEIPEGIRMHPYDASSFSKLMASCKGMITTAGFDTAAEAAYHGIPLAVIPSYNHYEQKCNGADISANSIGIVVSQIDRGVLEAIGPSDNRAYRAWVNRAAEEVLKYLEG